MNGTSTKKRSSPAFPFLGFRQEARLAEEEMDEAEVSPGETMIEMGLFLWCMERMEVSENGASMENHGKSRNIRIVENHGKSWKVMLNG